MASVDIEGLTKWYGKRRGVEDLSLKISDKEFLTMFGPAGAGKTTTLNLIAGIVTPTRGTVKIAGRNIDGLEPAERNVAMVFESYALYPQLTVFDNMAFPLRSPKHKQSEEKVRERVTHYAKVMKIDHLLDRRIQALSNGQRQRTALGRALGRQPDVFLLDEPLSHLDAKLRHSMRAELKEMRSQLGTTTIYVTHDYLEAMSLGDRIAVIDRGCIQQVGTPNEVYFRPASTDVAQLFGDPEINLTDAVLKSKGGTQLQLQILGENAALPVAADVTRILHERGKERIRIGFRPSDVHILPNGNKDAFRGVVYSFEPLGTKSVLTVEAVDGTRIRALIDGHLTFEIDRRVQFSLEPHSLIIFDAETRAFLARSEQPAEEVLYG
jgi:multiple sugar transport system ATP-binding protein